MHIHSWLSDSLPRECSVLWGLVYVNVCIKKNRAHCIFFTVDTAACTDSMFRTQWWASMTQHEEPINTSRSQSAETGVTHHYCTRKGTQQIHPAGCPGSLLCPHRCLRPGGTWAGSHNFSLGCPGCPFSLTPEPWSDGGWRWGTENLDG